MYKRAVSLALLALLAGGLEGLAQKPSKPARDATALRQTPPVAQVSLATVAESEPNDDNTTADAVTLGDVGVGETSPAGDWDWWSFTATAGQIIEIDVDANDFGSPLD
ncbi:MAG TPA: hypothetical protein VLC48_09170, partial [Gemmatimonadota bacterium]|nr:hypothetical protein [Gemmatimonadota bacterium]